MTPGQIAFEAYHGHRHYEDWPADDRIAKKWEACAAAIRTAALEEAAQVCEQVECDGGIALTCAERIRALAHS
jgi:hypothetical protein